MAKLLYRPDEVAEMLSISRWTLYRMMADKQIVFVWVRGRRRIHQSEVVKILSGEMLQNDTICTKKNKKLFKKRISSQPSQKFVKWVARFGVVRLARKLSMARSTVHNWVTPTCNRQTPRIETVFKIIALSKAEPLCGEEILTVSDILGEATNENQR